MIMATIDTLCALVEIDKIDPDPRSGPPIYVIKRIVRTYEGEARALEDLELLQETNPNTRYRIDQIQHIER
jgi:hypothetical protein